MLRRFLLVTLMLTLVVLTLTACPDNSTPSGNNTSSGNSNNAPDDKAAESQGLSLSQIQNQSGVYIKRGEEFFKIGKHGANELFYNTMAGFTSYKPNLKIILAGNPDEYLRLQSGDQLVFVGSEPKFYPLSSLGFTTKYTDVVSDSSGKLAYTHINGTDLADEPQLKEQHYFKIESWHDMVYSWILIGDEGQELALGRWNNTSWTEKTYTTDTEFFQVGDEIGYTLTKTYDGYFIIDFNSEVSGLICIGDKQKGYSFDDITSTSNDGFSGIFIVN